MITKDLLKANNIETVALVDDGLDTTPFLSDLGGVRDQWAVFWDDLSKADKKLLDEIFPDHNSQDAEVLIDDLGFVTAVFASRDQFESAALVDVFEVFLVKQVEVKRFIAEAETLLSGWGLKVVRSGREFVDAAVSADLLIVDLFLGSEQGELDKKRSMDGIRDILTKRVSNPPPIILTSAHTDLNNLRHDFRDYTGLLASGFRTLGKSEIHVAGHLEELVYELVSHRENSLKLGAFLTSWKIGMPKALKRATTEMRKLDLEDIAHLQKLMLADEGAAVGCYLVDVMDQVLLHELEAEGVVIDAAKELNNMTSIEFPPNVITGSKDTLSVVRKTLYVNDKRRKLDSDDGFPVRFGDVLATNASILDRVGTIFEGKEERVYVVLTPNCDLVRENPKAKRALLLSGTCKALTAQAYKTQNAKALHTPVLKLSGQRRFIVNWDLKHIETVSLNALVTMFGEVEGAYVACRMREHTATALQQTLVSDLGRVGEMRVMPSMFPVECKIYYTDAEKALKPLDMTLSGVCVIGTDLSILAFDAGQRREFQSCVVGAAEDVFPKSSEKLASTLTAEALNQLFTRGFVYKMTDKPLPCEIDIGGKKVQIGKVILNQDATIIFKEPGPRQGEGLIFELTEDILLGRGLLSYD